MKILENTFNPVFTLRSMFIFESIAEKPFEVKTTFDTYIYFYSCLVANKDNPHLDFDEFIDYCDGHPEVFTEFNELLKMEMERKEMNGKKKVVMENN